jgi:hypothetical protein
VLLGFPQRRALLRARRLDQGVQPGRIRVGQGFQQVGIGAELAVQLGAGIGGQRRQEALPVMPGPWYG